jgi:hypothetical protein
MLNWRKPVGTNLWESKSLREIVYLIQKLYRGNKPCYVLNVFPAKIPIEIKEYETLSAAKQGAEKLSAKIMKHPINSYGPKKMERLIYLFVEEELNEEILFEINKRIEKTKKKIHAIWRSVK